MKAAVYILITLATALGMQSCSAQQPDIDVKNGLLVDVRTPEEFAEGTVPGAINIPLIEISKRLDEFKGKKQVVVFCRSGNRSSQAQAILNANGISNVVNGGTWQQVNKVVNAQPAK